MVVVLMLTSALVTLQVGRLLVLFVAVWPFARVALHRFRVGGGVAVAAPKARWPFRYLYSWPRCAWLDLHSLADLGSLLMRALHSASLVPSHDLTEAVDLFRERRRRNPPANHGKPTCTLPILFG
jgi:hypothetical protein